MPLREFLKSFQILYARGRFHGASFCQRERRLNKYEMATRIQKYVFNFSKAPLVCSGHCFSTEQMPAASIAHAYAECRSARSGHGFQYRKDAFCINHTCIRTVVISTLCSGQQMSDHFIFLLSGLCASAAVLHKTEL